MIAKGLRPNNENREVIHRFHKRQSCVFHSVHRFSEDFTRPRRGFGEERRLDGSVCFGAPATRYRHAHGWRETAPIDTLESAHI